MNEMVDDVLALAKRFCTERWSAAYALSVLGAETLRTGGRVVLKPKAAWASQMSFWIATEQDRQWAHDLLIEVVPEAAPLTLESFARRLGRANELPGDRWKDAYRFAVAPEGGAPGLIAVTVLREPPALEGRVRWVLVVRP
jgi:hypothetical protein